MAPQKALADTAGSGNCQQTFTKTGTGHVDVFESGGYCFVAFKNTGAVDSQTTYSWTRPSGLNAVDVLVVGGGGSGGARHGGGGGAGGFVQTDGFVVSAASTVSIAVGAGGNGSTSLVGTNGQNSYFRITANGNGLTALGGGAGANGLAGSGGSGGGAGAGQNAGGVTPQSQTNFAGTTLDGISFGNNGAAGANDTNAGSNVDNNDYWAGGGGGGAGLNQSGENPRSNGTLVTTFSTGTNTTAVGGKGGDGRSVSWISSTVAAANALNIGHNVSSVVYFAGGGGGGMGADGAAGGPGGNGGGATGSRIEATGNAGMAFTGGGGGGSGFDDINKTGSTTTVSAADAGDGGSGIVVIRYQVRPAAPTITGITGGNTSLSVAFTPASDEITVSGYKYSTDGGATWSASTGSTSSPISITGLTNATSYQVQIRSVSSYWDGVATATTNATAGVACSKTESSAGGYTTVTFSSTGNCVWAVPDGVTKVDVLAVGGGGGGGVWVAGGGGGGGVTETTGVATTPGSLHTITVGAGGTGSSLTQSSGSGGTFTAGSNGGQSSALGVSAGGGGLGASWTNAAGSSATGGGASGLGTGGIGSVAGTGNNGGNGGAATGAHPTYYEYGYPAGGGGGAGGNGGSAVYNLNTNGAAGDGGVGEVSLITGLTYGGGGGGGCHGAATTLVCVNGSGVNGGGNGGGVTAGTTPASHTYDTATSGAPNTGGGGGGAGTPNGGAWPTAARSGGSGGSGIVVIRYVNAPSISLAGATINAVVGTAIESYSISNSNGPAASYAISPSLSVSGLSFSTSTGLISGTPTASANTTTYTITATNSSGTSTATFSLTSNYPVCSPTTSSASGYTTVTFTTVTACSWSIPSGVSTAEVLVVGGGGGGGANVGSGGAGAGVYYNNSLALTGGATSIVKVGAGGTPGTYTPNSPNGGNGDSSTFGTGSSTITSAGGGGGKTHWQTLVCNGSTVQSATSNDTGGAHGGSLTGKGGLGGASSLSGGNGANGGAGVSVNFGGSGALIYGAGGGGGAWNGTGGKAGNNVANSGAGNGASGSGVAGSSGTDNRGGGGGGGEVNCAVGGAGGSGVVIVRYTNAAVTPSISSHPANQTKTAGQSATFSVTATKSDPGTLTYQWQKDGVNISGATTATYNIASTTTSNSGDYRVIVTNTWGNTTASTTSNVASLTVSSALEITTPNTGLKGTVGSAYTLNISSSGGSGGNTFSLTAGSLPSGLTLNSGTGAISGTPTEAGISNITVRVTDSNTATATTSSFELAISCPASSTIVSSGLILHLDAGSTCATSTLNLWRDISGNSRNLTWISAPTRETSFGGFYDFNRANSHYGTFTSNGLSDFTNGFTISFYASFDATGSGGWERIIDFGNGDNSDNIVVAREGSTNRLILEFRRGASESLECSAAIIVDGAWAHYAVTVDPSTGNSNTACKIYKNGISQSLFTNRPSSPFMPNNIARTKNYLGESNWTADAFFDGGIGDLAIYNRALSLAEITTNFESQRATSVVTYEYNSATGGNSTASENYIVGGTSLTLPTPTRTNHTFGGWYGEVGLTTLIGNGGASYSPTNSITLYAKWTANVAITFNSNGGAGSMDSQTAAINSSVTLSANAFTRSGYSFVEWTTASNGSGTAYSDAQTTTFAQDVTLYAQWTKIRTTNLQVNLDATNLQSLATNSTTWKSVRPGTSTSSQNRGGGVTYDATNSIVSLTFDGDGDYYEYTTVGDSRTTGAMTFEMWINPGNLRNGWNILATRWFSGTAGQAISSNDWHFAIRNNNNAGLRLNLYTTNSPDRYGSRIFAASDEWMLVGFTIDASGNLKFYVNGVQDGTTYNSISRTNQSASKFFIGDPRANAGFPGGISKVRLYGAALSSAEMLANFDAEYLYYRLNKVTFNENYGATPATSTQYLARSTATNLTANGFTRAAYNFNGWNTAADGSGTNYTNSQSVTLTEDLTLYAKWTSATYSVTYDSQGGTPITSGTFVQGGAIANSPGTPVRAGYTFNGWYAASTGGSALTFPYSPGVSQAITLYAQWSVNTYAVTYDSQGGSDISSGSYATGGNIASSPGSPTRSGYTFNGWFIAATGGTAITFPFTPGLTRDLTIYAQWTAINYNITYSSNEASSGTVPSDANNYTIGQKITVKANTGSLVRTGYTFAGWNTAANGGGTTYLSGTEYTVGSANITLYAKWNANTYTITYNTNGASGSAQRSNSNVTSDSYTTGGATITLPGVGTMSKTGHDFGGWSETTSGAAVSDNLTTTSNKTLYARWTLQNIAVNFSKGIAAGVNINNFPADTTMQYGSTLTLNSTLTSTVVINGSPHVFVGWSYNSSIYQGGSEFLIGTASPTFTAEWVKVFAVRYSFSGGTPANNSSEVDGECLFQDGNDLRCTENQVITSNAAPSRTGYTFSGWIDQTGAAVATASQFTVTSQRYLLYAQWTPVNYTVTYDPNSGATTPTQASRQIGQTFTVANAISRTGYSFNGWSDGTRNYGPGATYTVGSANVTLTAQWIADVYTITYDWNGGRGSAEADASYTVGTGALTLPLVGDRVKDGYTFSGWSLTPSGDLVGLTYTPTQSITLYAIWGTGSYTLTFNANGGTNAGGTDSAQIQNGSSTTLPTPTRSNFVFDGWYSAATGGTLVGAAGASYQPTQSRSIYARWTQASLAGLSPSVLTRIGTTTTADGVSTSFSGANITSAVSISIPAGALPAGTVVNFDLVGDVSRARTAISNANSYIVSIVVSWLATDGSVPDTAADKPIAVTIQNAAIKAGASVYKIIFQNGQSVPTFLTTATQDGIVTVNITTDPEVVVAVTKPGAPTSVSATSNGNLQSVISWSAPASNGGATITSYTATANTGQSCQTATLTCTITGLSAGTAYTFTVTATNSQGTSDSSSSASATTASNYTVTFNSNGGSNVANSSFLTGGSLSAPANPTKTGYSFAGWSDTDGGSAVLFDYSPGVNQNITLYALWSANSYSVTFNSNSGSSVSDGSFTTGGTVAEPTAPTRTGYTFAGWAATDGGTVLSFPYSPGVTSNITLYAKWTGDSHTVTFNSNGGSVVANGSFISGGTLNAPTAPTRSGYTFAGWSATDGGAAINFPYAPGVTNGITLFAKWNEVSQNSGGGGGGSGNSGASNSSSSSSSNSSQGSSGNKPSTPTVVKVKPVEVVGASQAKIPTVELPIAEPATNSSGVKVERTVKVVGAEAKITDSVKIVNNQLVIVPVEGFSGKRNFTVSITEGSETKTIEIPLVVLPEPAKAPVVQPTSLRKTTIDWKASPNADKYEVFVNGKRVCSTSKTECTVNQLIGPGAQVEIISNGGDRTRSEAAPADYEQNKPIQVARLSGSTRIKPTLSSLDEKLLNDVIALIKKQGFGNVIITDVTTSKQNREAAAKRIAAIKEYIGERVGEVQIEFRVIEPSRKTFLNTVSLGE